MKQGDALSLSKGWEIKRLSEIGKVYNGNSINEKIKKDNYSELNEGFPYIATKDVSYKSQINYDNGIKIPFEERAKFKVAPKNTVLICAEGGSAGRKIAFTNQEVCFGNKLFALSTNENIESRFVYYYFFSSIFQKYFSTELAGIIGGVSMNKFKDIEIPIPPISEQKRIVTILDEVFDAIATAKKNSEQNLQNANELFENYLESVFENKTNGWKIKTLGAILSEPPKNGWSPPAKNHSDSGIPVLTLSAVTGFVFKANCVKYTNANVKKNAPYWINSGDLLITRSNTPELVGHVAVCKNLVNMTIYPDLMMKINPNESVVLTQFLYYQLRSPKLRRIIKNSAHGANPTMKKINKQDVEGFEISYPSLLEQLIIVQKLDDLVLEKQRLDDIYRKKINDLEELKKSVLQKVFSGELKTNKSDLKTRKKVMA